MRIAVPDLDAEIIEYDPARSMDWAIKFFEASDDFPGRMHHFMYNFESLKGLLKSVGFHDVFRREFGEGVCPDAEKLDNRPASLFVEAIN